ncbi:MAG: 1,2-phenylacetyl-CoA epoxidase subunit A, partial [Paenisporosarcina sp.]
MASLNTISEESQLANFMQRIEAGEKIEADDWM